MANEDEEYKEKTNLLNKRGDNSSLNDSSEPSTDSNFSIRGLTARGKYTLLMLALANLFSGCGFSLMAPFFPEEAELKGVSTTVTGLIFSLFELAIFLSSPVFGNYLTRIGAKFMFISGIFVGGCCAILFGTLNKCPPGTIFVVMCMLVRTVEALGISAFVTASFAIITNEFPKNVATVFGILETASGVGLMIGPALGGAIYEVGGFGPPFFVVGILILINGALVYSFLPSPQGEAAAKRKMPMYHLLRSPTILVTMVTIMTAAIGFSFLDPTFSKHLEKFNLSNTIIGLFFTITPALYAVTSPIWGHLSDSKNIPAVLITIGNLVVGIGFLFIGPSPLLPFLPYELWTIIVGLVITGTCVGCAVVPTMKCLVNGALEIGFEDNIDTFGIVSGLFLSMWCFGAFVGPTLGGVLVDELGFDWAATIVSGCYLFAMVLTLVFFASRRKRSSSTQDVVIDIAHPEEATVDVLSTSSRHEHDGRPRSVSRHLSLITSNTYQSS